jgi:hypothetical protein
VINAEVRFIDLILTKHSKQNEKAHLLDPRTDALKTASNILFLGAAWRNIRQIIGPASIGRISRSTPRYRLLPGAPVNASGW